MGVSATNLWLQARPATVAAAPPKQVEIEPGAKPAAAKPVKTKTPDTGLLGWLAGAAPKDEPKRFEKLNFIIQLPDGPWSELNPKSIGSEACYVGRQTRKKLVTSIVIEPLGVAITSEGLTEIVRTNLQDAGKLLDWKLLEPAGLAGISSPCAGYVLEINGQRVSYVNIHHIDHGYARQFVVGSTKALPLAELRGTAIELAKGFQLIDPQRVGATGQPTLEPAAFPQWGCEMKAGGKDWTQATTDERVRGEIWHGNFRGTSHLIVIPVNLGNLKTDDPALLRGLLSGSTGREFPETGFTGKPLSIRGAENAVEYEYQEKLEDVGDYHRILRVIRRGQVAWLLDGGTRAGVPERMEELRRSMDAFRLHETAPVTLPTNGDDFHAPFCNQAGLSFYLRERYTEARPFFEEAIRVKPDKITYLSNLLDSFEQEGNSGALLKRAETALPAQLKSPDIRQRLAAAFASSGKFNEARDAYKSLFADNFRNDDILQQAIDFLLENNGKSDALELIESYQKGGTSQKLDRLQASVLVRNGRHKDAAVVLEKLHAGAPGNSGVLIELADVYAILKRHDEAIALLREALVKEPKSPILLYNIGYQLADCGKFEESAEILEQAAAIAPKDETIHDELAFVRSRLGRGHDREIRTELDPVPLPASLEVPADWKSTAVAPDADRYHLLHVTAYHFEPGTPIARTAHNDILALTDRSVEALSTLRFDFHPLSERVFVNRLEVIDSTGKVIATGKQKDYYVTDEGGEEATSSKVLCVPVPGLAIGCRVRYSVTYRDRSPSREFPFDANFFFTRYGARVTAVCVRGAVDTCASLTRGAVETRDENGFRIWSARDLPALPDDSRMALIERFVPSVYIGPTGTDWKKLGDKYLDEIDTQLKVDPDIESLARDLVADAPDDAAKIRTLFRWIQSEFTYKAIEFGTRARIPHPAGVTCANRYGDCKDLSVLLHSMLRAAGIDSRLCLVNTEDLIIHEIPSLDQFNHMIVYLPAAGGRPASWLDPTDRHHALVTTVSPWLEKQSTLVLGKDSSRFETVPELPFPSPHRMRIDRRLEAGKNSDLLVSETLTMHGYSADGMRSYITSIPAAERLQRLREWISSIDSSLTLNTLEVKNLKDQDSPFVLELTLTAAAHLDEAGKLKQVPVDFERNYLRPVAQLQRTTPFATSRAWQVESRTTGSIPLPDAAKPGSSDHPKWGDWKLEFAGGKDAWHIDYAGRQRRGDLFDAKDYPGFFDFWDSGLNQLARPWQVK